LFDVATAGAVLLIFFPIFAYFYFAARKYGPGVRHTLRGGKGKRHFEELSFDFPLGHRLHQWSRLGSVFNILAGDMSWVGPECKSPYEVEALGQLGVERLRVRPGLFCLWWIHKRANIAYGSEPETAVLYVRSVSFPGNLGILVRVFVVSCFGISRPEHAISRDLQVLGVRIDNLTMTQAVAAIATRLGRSRSYQVSFVNAHSFNVLYDDPSYFYSLERSDLVFADGIGVRLAAKAFGNSIRQNVNGTDLFPLLCAAMEKKRSGIYLLGGKPGVVEAVARWIGLNYPDLRVSGFHHGYFQSDETPEVVTRIRESGADVLLVAFGVPQQENWIHQHLDELGNVVAIGVGGLFDFYSGRIPRAPEWVRELGAEWLFRFSQEPRRLWKRYLVGNFRFMGLVLRRQDLRPRG
jgi:N-acetylglucosaminyldiphosphoundecaprenol N-acetyl-beta-D-mannosaminyltransferase